MQNIDDTTSVHSVDEEECNTPTHTSIADADLESETTYASPGRTTVGVCPWKDATFVIRDPKTELAIALKEGTLGLYPPEEQYGGGTYRYGCGSHCICEENKGMWLGFKNAVSGKYIRHDNNKSRWRFDAKGERHDKWEYFCAREHPNGGHVLLVKHRDDLLPMKVGGENNRELVVDTKSEGGTAWEFIRVDSKF